MLSSIVVSKNKKNVKKNGVRLQPCKSCFMIAVLYVRIDSVLQVMPYVIIIKIISSPIPRGTRCT